MSPRSNHCRVQPTGPGCARPGRSLRCRTWVLAAVALNCAALIAVASCQIRSPHNFATASALPSAARKPDGVAVDLRASLLPATSRGSTTMGLAALSEPPDTTGALTVVRSFFGAVSREDLATLRSTLSADASLGPLSGPANAPAERQWEQRVHKLDYKAIGPEPVFRESTIEVYGYRDLELSEGDRPNRPPSMAPDDVLVRVPIEIRRIGADRLFGDEIIFLVKRVDGAFKIRAMLEDFQPP
jgi:hypothetical protein